MTQSAVSNVSGGFYNERKATITDTAQFQHHQTVTVSIAEDIHSLYLLTYLTKSGCHVADVKRSKSHTA